MTNQARFAALTVESASDAARPLLKASASNFGFLPAPVAKAAHSPALLKHLLAGFAAFERTALAALEREVVAFTVAFEVECSYCIAMHSAIMSGVPETPTGLLESLRAGSALADPRLEALRQFVRETVRSLGRVSEARWAELDAAGFTQEQALDALLGVGVYLLSTFTNVMTRAELDAPFEAFRWRNAEAATEQ
jgi:AhpD family alkylhydroperoxidase